MDVTEQLKSETKKWHELIKAERPKVKIIDKSIADFLENIDAYVADSEHFMVHNDYVRAFEAIVWAWSWLEIGERMGILKRA